MNAQMRLGGFTPDLRMKVRLYYRTVRRYNSRPSARTATEVYLWSIVSKGRRP
jgi:hypothetical protein